MPHAEINILASEFVTPDTKRFVTEKPKDLIYPPGQSLLLSIDLPKYKDIVRPYSMTSVNDWKYLEFFIKSYPNGKFSQKVTSLNAGEKFIYHGDVNGIKFKGPGIFIAGGTGITAFIAILRALYLSKNMRNVGLIYSVQSPEDVLIGAELKKILGDNLKMVFTRYKVIGFREKRIDKNFLIDSIGSFDKHFYIAGPTEFVKDISGYLMDLGAENEQIVI